ncbi:MAG TPA: glycosyltransferase family 9 protein [Burkholderiaceae bacterium]
MPRCNQGKHSLQKGPGQEEALAPPVDRPITPIGHLIEDFADMAAVIASLDCVVTIDSAIAHLAGAMHKPCFVLLPAIGCDWRWMLNRPDSPWYPTAGLYRQDAPGNWSPTIESLAKHLQSTFSR